MADGIPGKHDGSDSAGPPLASPDLEDGLLPRLRLLVKSPATVALTLCNVGVFIIAEQTGSTLEVETLLRFGASSRELVWGGESWRLITPMFLHVGLFHLLWNTYAGFGWCRPVEVALGWRRFLAIYLLSGIGGAAVSVIGHDVVSAGASGALFGIAGAALTLGFRRHGSLRAFILDPDIRRELRGLGIWSLLCIGFLDVDNFAHLGGLLFGVILTCAFTTPVRAGRRFPFGLPLAFASVAAVAGLAMHPLPVLHADKRIELAATEALTARDYQEVLRLTEEAARNASKRDAWLHLRGFAFLNLGDHEAARGAGERLIELYPDYADGHRLRGEARLRLGDPVGAERDLSSAISLTSEDPLLHDPVLHYWRAHARYGKQDLEGAKSDLDSALRGDPRMDGARLLRAWILGEEGRVSEALTELEASAALLPDDLAYQLEHSRVRIHLGATQQAHHALLRLLRAHPDHPSILEHLCSSVPRTPPFEEAESACTRALEVSPKSTTALVNRGLVRHLQARRAEALADLDAALTIDPNHSEANVGRGFIRFLSEDLDGALRDAESVLQRENSPEAYRLRATVLVARGQSEEAVEDFRRALEHAWPNWQGRAEVEAQLSALTSGPLVKKRP